MEIKKIVLKLDFDDEKIKQKAMKKISGISGLESIAFDPKDRKLTVVGDIDPVAIVAKLRKLCRTDIITVGPAKEPEKKKEEPKKDAAPKKDDPKKNDGPKQDLAQVIKAHPALYQPPYYYQYQQYHQQVPMVAPPYYGRSVEEDPNGCVIC